VKLKVTGVVKHGGAWKRPGDELADADEAIGNDLIAKGVAVEVAKTETEKAAEEQAKAAVEAAKKAEKELKALRKKAAELGIEGAAEKEADTLATEIAAAEQK
jgi:hypothetical protein